MSPTQTPPDLRFFAAGIPATQGSHRIVRGRIIPDNPPKLTAWRRRIAADALGAIPSAVPLPLIPKGQAVTVAAAFVLPRPKALPKTLATRRHATRLDVDKLARAAFDSLTAARIWGDDGQVDTLLATKRYAELNEATGVWVSIYSAPVAVELKAVA